MTVTLGTVAEATACSIFAPWRMIPAASTLVPTMNPGTSTRNTSGIANASHSVAKRVLAPVDGVGRGQDRRGLLAARGEERKVALDHRDALRVVGALDVADP